MSTFKKASGALLFATSAIIGLSALTGCDNSGHGTAPGTTTTVAPTATSSTSPTSDTATSAAPASSAPAAAPPPPARPQATEPPAPQPEATEHQAPQTHPQTAAPKPPPTLSDPGFTPRAGY